jgi:signal transduction histidine kinase
VVEWVNDAFERRFGWSAAEIVGASPLRLHARETDIASMRALLTKLQRDGVARLQGVVRKRSDGGRLIGDLLVLRLAGADGAPRRVFHFRGAAVIEAVSSAASALAQLLRLRQALRSDQCELQVLRRVGTEHDAAITAALRQVEQLSEALSSSQASRFAVERSLAELEWRRSQAQEEADVAVEELQHSNQRLRELNRMLDERARRSESQRDAVQIDLDHSHRVHADLLGVVSLELRAPLASVLADAQKLGATEIVEKVRRMIVLLDALLGDAEDDALAELHVAEIEVTMAHAIALTRGEAVRRGVSLRLDRNRCKGVAADRHLLLCCLVELLAGAVRHTRSGGVITVDCRERGERLVVTVHDEGGGIDPASAETGFAQLRRLAGALRGGLSIESRAGQGTMVRLDLPRTVPAHRAQLGSLQPASG